MYSKAIVDIQSKVSVSGKLDVQGTIATMNNTACIYPRTFSYYVHVRGVVHSSALALCISAKTVYSWSHTTTPGNHACTLACRCTLCTHTLIYMKCTHIPLCRFSSIDNDCQIMGIAFYRKKKWKDMLICWLSNSKWLQKFWKNYTMNTRVVQKMYWILFNSWIAGLSGKQKQTIII